MRGLSHLLKSKKGVTLIELLVVVVILGIIAAVTIPMVLSNQTMALASSNQQNLAIVQEAVERYAIDHNGNYPIDTSGSIHVVNFVQLTNKTTKGGIVSGSGANLGPYLKERPIFYVDGNPTAANLPITANGKVSLPSGADQ